MGLVQIFEQRLLTLPRTVFNPGLLGSLGLLLLVCEMKWFDDG